MISILRPIQRRRWRSFVRDAAIRHELTYLFWETTLACNLACRHCGSECSRNSAQDNELTTQEVEAVFASIAEDCDSSRVMVAVTGGEPLLRPDVFEVTAHLRGLGFRWGMVTNGTLMTDEAVARCEAAGMETVSVSIDGLKHHHEFLRGPRSFEKAVEAVRRLKRAAFLDALEVVSCPTGAFVREIDVVYEFVCSLGIDGWRLIPLAPIGRVRGHPELRLSGAELRQLLEWLRARRADHRSPLKVSVDEEGFLGDRDEHLVRDSPDLCFAGVHSADFLANGDVSGCPSIDRRFVQGNVRRRRFSDIWEHEFRHFRDRNWMRQGPCARCRNFPDCLGNSLHLWESPDAGGPAYCHMALLARE